VNATARGIAAARHRVRLTRVAKVYLAAREKLD
jgi:hypothetical protein